jgi:hypothetical protein
MASPLFIGAIIGLSLIIFWNMLASYEGGQFIEFNETEEDVNFTSVALIDTTFWIDLGDYRILEFQARRGDILNITVEVLDGGPADYFLMETAKKEQFEGWFNGTEVKFFAYENGKGLNITYSELQFTVPKTDNWYIILNNYGHMKDGAFAVNEVHLWVKIEKVGFTEEQSFG